MITIFGDLHAFLGCVLFVSRNSPDWEFRCSVYNDWKRCGYRERHLKISVLQLTIYLIPIASSISLHIIEIYNMTMEHSRVPIMEHNSSSDTLSQPDEISLDQTLRWIPEPPPTYYASTTPRLQKPVAIPRMDVAGRLAVRLPFLRAYSPALRAHDIHETDFLAFVDNLTIAQAPSPPLQVLNIAGQGIGMM
jgi:hypothetical protein